MTPDRHPLETEARRQLAACYRLFDVLGWAEGIFNHITLRVPSNEGNGAGGAHYLINPFGLHYGEVTAENLVKIDVEGRDVEGSGRDVNRAGFVIHGALHSARGDAHCVMHTHTTAGCAVSCKAEGLRHDNFYSAMMWGDVGYHAYEGVTTSLEERPRLVRSLGSHHHLILRNHGLLVVGESLPRAFHRLWTMQRACEIQLASDAASGPSLPIAAEVLERVPASRLGANRAGEDIATQLFNAMLRRAGVQF